MGELDQKETWVPKNGCFWTVVLEKTLESPLDCKKIQAIHPKGDQSWIFFARTDAETQTPILWPPDAKNWLIGKDWCWERLKETGTTEDEMVGWHHQLDEHEFEQTLGDGDGQGSLACCSPWGFKELDMNECWTELKEVEVVTLRGNTYLATFKENQEDQKIWVKRVCVLWKVTMDSLLPHLFVLSSYNISILPTQDCLIW